MTPSSRFSAAVHVLLLLTLHEQPQTSSVIANSVGMHAVVVRRILGLLKKAGLVTGRVGPAGGFSLARRPDAIGLDQVFRAMAERGAPALHEPNPACPVGRRVRTALRTIGGEAEQALLESLASHTLADTLQMAGLARPRR